MNRFALLAIAVVAIIIGWLVFFAGPVVEAPPPVKAPTLQPPEPPPAETPVAPAPTPPPVEPPPAAPDAGPAPDAATETGPSWVDLGRHTILFAERDGRFLEIELRLHTDTRADAEAVQRRRRQLVRMLYFLVTKRSAEASAEPGSKTRLIEDLKPRFVNAMRTGRISRIEVRHWQIVQKEMPKPPAPDGPAEEEGAP